MNESLRDTLRWWEPRRLLYNAMLTTVFLLLSTRHWERLRPTLGWDKLPPLAVLVLLANLCYSLAHLLDPVIQAGADGAPRQRLRWSIWSLGTLAAVLIETYWFLDEILPPPV